MFFLCSLFLISQFTATITTPPVTVVCSGASPITMAVTMAPPLGIAASGQHDVVLPPQLILSGLLRCSINLTTATTSVLDAFSSLCQLCNWSSPSKFSLSELSLHEFIVLYVGACYGICFQVPMWLPCSPMGAQALRFTML